MLLLSRPLAGEVAARSAAGEGELSTDLDSRRIPLTRIAAQSDFSVLKRGIMGTDHHVSPKHLKRYLAEFDFRYNERMALGVTDEAHTTKVLRGIVGKRHMYRDLFVG
jgi:hypothetical protein